MNIIKSITHFYFFVIHRFMQQRCNEMAASLSYTSLLSIVPIMAVIFAAFSSFPVFNDALEQIQGFIFNNLVPSSSELIQQYLNIFVAKASKLTLVGMISLFIIALLLMRQIDKSLNQIWDVQQSKDYLRIFLIYWAVLTLGPILIGMSLMLTSYLSQLIMFNDMTELLGVNQFVFLMLPIILTMTAFTLIYMIVPNYRVAFSHALIGGLTATILFELAKKTFALYISYNQTYSNLYGALATIPIFLIWIYICWLITLLGAMTARSMILFDFSNSMQKNTGNHFFIVFHILRLLANAAKTGNSLSISSFHGDPVLSHETQLITILKQLEGLSWINKTQQSMWSLAIDLELLSLWDLYSKFPYVLTQADVAATDPIVNIVKKGNKLLADEFNIPIKKLLVQYDNQLDAL